MQLNTIRTLGPNGNHYPEDAPYLYDDTIPNVIEVPCTWAAIEAARRALTPAQIAAKTKIAVQPGVLPGNGASAGSSPVMGRQSPVGSPDDPYKVLITPRDGVGTVTFSGSIRLNRVHSTAFVGFANYPYGVTLTGCSNTDYAWFTAAAWRVCGLSGQITRNCNIIEGVIANSQVGNSDPAGFGSGYVTNLDQVAAGSGALLGCSAIGCYNAPQYLAPGGGGHNDSLQLYGGGGIYNDFLIKDTALFGSNNSALQAGGFPSDPRVAAFVGDAQFLTLDNVLLLNGAASAKTRYPLPPEALQTITGQAINGSGRPGFLNANGVIAVGTIYTKSLLSVDWNIVSDSRCSGTTRFAKVGAWVQDTSLSFMTGADIDALGVPYPTDDYLAQIWARPTDPIIIQAVTDLDVAWATLSAQQDIQGIDRTAETAAWNAFRSSIPKDLR